jgi:hypothetical protein
MPSGPLIRRLPLDQDRAAELAGSLTEGDVEYLIRQVRARIRREEKQASRRSRPVPAHGRDANAYKLERSRDLERRLVRALGRDPDDPAERAA